jgi:hypothetical protein
MATCDFLGFTTLECPTIPDRQDPYLATPWAKSIGNKPLRGVNTGGIFVLEYVFCLPFFFLPILSFVLTLRPWITPNFTQWTLEMDDQHKYSLKNPVGSAGYNILVDHWYTLAAESMF